METQDLVTFGIVCLIVCVVAVLLRRGGTAQRSEATSGDDSEVESGTEEDVVTKQSLGQETPRTPPGNERPERKRRQ